VEFRLIFRVASNPAREAAIRATHVKREYGSSQAKRGPILPFPDGKTRITIRHDDDVLGWFSGASELRWRQLSPSLIVEPIGAFRAYSAHLGELETTLRRVIREELGSASYNQGNWPIPLR